MKQQQRTTGKIKDLYSLINNSTRREILNSLSWNNLSYHELQELVLRTEQEKGNKSRKFHLTITDYHLKVLKAQYLIAKLNKNGLYYITYRGKVVLRAIKEIEDSEIFISKVRES